MARFNRFDGCTKLGLALLSAFPAGCTRDPAGPATSAASPPAATQGLVSPGSAAPARGARLGPERTFLGMCDASGAVPLSENMLLVADDEDNVLRIYDADQGGAPLRKIDVSPWLGLGSGTQASALKPEKAPETDIEAATRVGDLAFWLTSHGRSSSGKFRPERLRFFATRIAEGRFEVDWVGSYDKLLADLLAEPKLMRFELARAAEHAPKDPGGLNIEGMTARVEGGVWIGFRNPVPEGRALLVSLLNPEQVVASGAKAEFGEPLTLELNGLGVRSLSAWRGQYLIVAGHTDSGSGSALYTWNGREQPVRVSALEFGDLNPEGFFSPEQRDAFMLLSDDGTRQVSGKECKRLKETESKTFRGVWVSLG